ncbi:hypothetical protein RCH14_000946 [Massilia sp. MP_M2]|uniref:hypothetical protein n=1 Tax=Massilia sp. MP_M2 TaxID=3071713 RepID=UPI00319D8D3D
MSALGRNRKLVAASVTQQKAVEFATSRSVVAVIFKTSHLFRKVTVEVDDKFMPTGVVLKGYWWWAFDWKNFRLSSMHSNQRRVDITTVGGKADYFPVVGARAVELTEYDFCEEEILPLDPCRRADTNLLWFDSDGVPSCSNWCRKTTLEDELRVRTSVWLYHLDKQEIVSRRRAYMEEMRVLLRTADISYKFWKRKGSVAHSNQFARQIADIERRLAETERFSRAKRAAVCAAAAEYSWIVEEGLV